MGRARESQRGAGDICRLHIPEESTVGSPPPQGTSLWGTRPPAEGSASAQSPQAMTESLLREPQARIRENPGLPAPAHPQGPTLGAVLNVNPILGLRVV